MDCYTNYQQVDLGFNIQYASPSESDSSSGTNKPRCVVNARERCRTQRLAAIINNMKFVLQ